MSLKVQKRIKKNSQAYQDEVFALSEELAEQAKSNETLFTLDRRGSTSAKRKVVAELLPQSKGVYKSVTEKKLIEKASTGVKRAPYAKLLSSVGSNKARDLWDDGSVDPVEITDDSRKRLRVALPPLPF